MVRDVYGSEERQTEDALHEAQAALAYATPLTMLGELTASIALEVNRPLRAIVTNGQASSAPWRARRWTCRRRGT